MNSRYNSQPFHVGQAISLTALALSLAGFGQLSVYALERNERAPTWYSRESTTTFYAKISREESPVVFRQQLHAKCAVSFVAGDVVSEEQQHIQWRRRGESCSASKKGASLERPLTATYQYNLLTGAQLGFLIGKVEVAPEQPYVGFELFFLPKELLAMQKPRLESGIVFLKSEERLTPSFRGMWTFRTHSQAEREVRVEGPVVLRSKDGSLSLSGYYLKECGLSPLRITRMKGEYLITVSNPREQRDFLDFARNSGQNATNVQQVDALIGHFTFDMQLQP